MNTLLNALGYQANYRGRIVLAALVGGGSLTALMGIEGLIHWARLPEIAMQVVLWLAWFVWLGWWFPRRRKAHLAADPAGAYRRAFYQDILPGIWLGFAQLSRPLLAALLNPIDTAPELFPVVLAGLISLSGAGLVFLGHYASDVASTMFVYEYRAPAGGIVGRGIYSTISHPMFLGAVLISAGVGWLAGGTALWLGLVNLLTLPVYGWAEDRRLRGIFGEAFGAYRRGVGGFVPRV